MLLNLFQQCEKYMYLAKNRNEILRRILNTYYESGDDVFLRVDTLYALGYMTTLSRDSLDFTYVIRESMKSSHEIEQKAAIVAFDHLLMTMETPQIHFDFLLGMILHYQDDLTISLWLIQLLRHMTYGPSILMQVSQQSISIPNREVYQSDVFHK